MATLQPTATIAGLAVADQQALARARRRLMAGAAAVRRRTALTGTTVVGLLLAAAAVAVAAQLFPFLLPAAMAALQLGATVVVVQAAQCSELLALPERFGKAAAVALETTLELAATAVTVALRPAAVAAALGLQHQAKVGTVATAWSACTAGKKWSLVNA